MTEAPVGAAHSWLVWARRSPIQTWINIGHPASPGAIRLQRDPKEALLIFLQSHCPQSSDPGWPGPNSTSSPTPWLVKTVGLAWAAGEVGGEQGWNWGSCQKGRGWREEVIPNTER